MTQATDERVFSETELTAIVADRVQRETASITAELDKLRADNTDLANKLDAEISGRQAIEKAKAEIDAEFTQFKESLEAEKAAMARKDERLKAVREAASHLDEKFYADENRVKRIVAMDEDTFVGYLDDLKVTAGAAPPSKDGLPRETAMAGQPVAGKDNGPSSARSFLTRSYAAKEA